MRAALLALAVTLGACQTPCPSPRTGSQDVAFSCDDGSELQVTFMFDRASARIVQAGFAPLELPARNTGSGYRYADNGAELRQRGAEVRWARPGAAETECRRQTQR